MRIYPNFFKIICSSTKEVYNHTKLVSLDTVNMFPNIDNQRGIQAIQDMLNTCAIKNHLQLFNRRTQVVSM